MELLGRRRLIAVRDEDLPEAQGQRGAVDREKPSEFHGVLLEVFPTPASGLIFRLLQQSPHGSRLIDIQSLGLRQKGGHGRAALVVAGPAHQDAVVSVEPQLGNGLGIVAQLDDRGWLLKVDLDHRGRISALETKSLGKVPSHP